MNRITEDMARWTVERVSIGERRYLALTAELPADARQFVLALWWDGEGRWMPSSFALLAGLRLDLERLAVLYVGEPPFTAPRLCGDAGLREAAERYEAKAARLLHAMPQR